MRGRAAHGATDLQKSEIIDSHNPHCEPKQVLTAGKLKSLQTSYRVSGSEW
jgi:hypothetical protein